MKIRLRRFGIRYQLHIKGYTATLARHRYAESQFCYFSPDLLFSIAKSLTIHTLNTFPQDILFKYPWRKYQQRVLDELRSHLTDRHLHIVAPPGSGKTVLGIEVAIRINQPTLILAPTLAIRNQWIQRFCELFLQTSEVPEWISRDIRQPKFLTVVTYQGLHSACNHVKASENEVEAEDHEAEEETTTLLRRSRNHNRNINQIIKGLKQVGVKTIVVDEAHHLKNEWWQTLIRLKDKLDPVIVGLTATPPYDVSPLEWHRYITLNGPVDTEISVPELVVERDLCPHQDYIYLTTPSREENIIIQDFRENAQRFFNELKQDETLLSAIESHPVWLNPVQHLEAIYEDISLYSASLIFLHSNSRSIPEDHLKIIGASEFDIPHLDYEWMACLLEFYLFKEKVHFEPYTEHRTTLENRLRRHGLIDGRRISFIKNKRVTTHLTSSISKLEGIKEIVSFEYEKLDKDLRMVILSDYIRKEHFPNSSTNTIEIKKMGVIPIFEMLRREQISGLKLGVLTGSLIIIPQRALAIFEEKARRYGHQQFTCSPVPFDDRYVIIQQNEQLKHDIIHIITQIFQRGDIEVLIGTKSLLGEGWDAPAINSLILASFVGSFVSSNQMRGRAIRTQRDNPGKTGNIWHLACIDPTAANGGDDLQLLHRRFRSFVGVSIDEPTVIENGIRRVMTVDGSLSQAEIINRNQQNLALAGNRQNLRQRWEKGLQSGVNLIEEIKVPFYEEQGYQAVKSLHLQKTISNFTGTLASGVVIYLETVLEIVLRTQRWIKTFHDAYLALSIIGVVGLLFFGYRSFKALRLYIGYRDIAKDMKNIGDAVLTCLIEADAVHTERTKLTVESSMDEHGAVFCHLEGGSTFEKSVFIHTLEEIIRPIDNPRYIIIRKSKFMTFLNQRDYHAVPEIFGRNKMLAEYFEKQWNNYVGHGELVFTRTLLGRQVLVKSRVKSLISQLDDQIEHVSKWK